jgi:hypothetical protein
MLVIVIEEQAFAHLALQFQLFALTVAMDVERPTRLDALENANQSVTHAVSGCDLGCFLLLADLARPQVDDRPFLLAGPLQ